jgi:hypothetical protein
MFNIGAALGLAGGLLGLVRDGQNRRRARGYEDAASRLASLQGDATEDALALAREYDPRADAEAAAARAREASGRALTDSLAELAERYKASGGDPKMDTAFGQVATRAARDITDPLSEFVADRAAGAALAKINALKNAASGGSGLAATYLDLARENRGDGGAGSLALIGPALDALLKRSGGRRPPGFGKFGQGSWRR